MSAEHQPRPDDSKERGPGELDALARERLEELQQSPEQAAEHVKQAEQRAEQAREVIQEHDQEPEPSAEPESTPRPTLATHLDQLLNYRHTVASMQRKLKPVSRSFSRVIHTPLVEKTSEVLEQTIMRPSVALGATTTALIVGLIFYITARQYGFVLSGTELLLALVGGGAVGYAIELILRLIRPKSR